MDRVCNSLRLLYSLIYWWRLTLWCCCFFSNGPLASYRLSVNKNHFPVARISTFVCFCLRKYKKRIVLIFHCTLSQNILQHIMFNYLISIKKIRFKRWSFYAMTKHYICVTFQFSAKNKINFINMQHLISHQSFKIISSLCIVVNSKQKTKNKQQKHAWFSLIMFAPS